MDRLLRLRTPLTAAALTMLSLVALARLGLGLSELVGVGGSTAVAAARLAPNGGDAALTVAVGVLVVSCFAGPPVARRRAFGVWTVLLALASVLATVMALALTDLEVAGWSLVWLIPDVSVPLLVGLVAAVLSRPEPAAGAGVAPDRADGAADGSEGSAQEAEVAAEEPDPELQPSWSEDAAAGAVWRTAGDAARGAPALGWGSGPTSWPSPEPVDAPAALPAGPRGGLDRDLGEGRAPGPTGWERGADRTDRADPSDRPA